MKVAAELIKFALLAGAVAACYFMPVEAMGMDGSTGQALAMLREYARLHVLTCLVPALFIAGAISVFVSRASIMKYLSPSAPKPAAYGVASVSGGLLSVCSCTVLPLFAGIYKMGAGLGPAVAFLYSGPAINVLAVVLTAAVLGPSLGVARAVGAIAFSIVAGIIMHALFRRDELRRSAAQAAAGPVPPPARPLWKNAMFFAAMAGVLVFANWSRGGDVRAVFLCCPGGLSEYEVRGAVVAENDKSIRIRDLAGVERDLPAGLLKSAEPLRPGSFNELVYRYRHAVAIGLLGAIALMLIRWFRPPELRQWALATWGLTKQIVPLLLAGVLAAGFCFGGPGRDGLIRSQWIAAAVGGNGPLANLAASVAGAFMYFATLTEVPIVQGLMHSGMGSGPALALLLAGPALSLPSMIVLAGIMGARKTLAYVALVVIMSTLVGMVFGMFVP